MQTLELTIDSVAQLHDCAARIARGLLPGDVVALSGEIGAGKTTLTQGLAAALGIPPEIVTSPTFTLIHEYAGKVLVRHCDVYRLRSVDEFVALGLDDLFGLDGIAIIEWADRVTAELPRDRLDIYLATLDETTRRLTMIAHGPSAERVLQTAALDSPSSVPHPDHGDHRS